MLMHKILIIEDDSPLLELYSIALKKKAMTPLQRKMARRPGIF